MLELSPAAPVQVAVAVPVRNEVERLPRLLAALAGQREAPPFLLCLFLDNCDDGSVALARASVGRMPYSIRLGCCDEGGPPNAGLARRRAMAVADAVARADGVLLTTDADGEPAPDWIAANLAALASADLVAGRMTRGEGPPCERQDRVEAYFDRLHAVRRAIDPVGWDGAPGHHWTSGASLALRAVTYRALGGFPPVPSGEDAALCDLAARAGYRVRRDARVVVRTSARRRGRAIGGFAAALAALDAAERPPAIVHPEDEAWRFRMHATARLLHGSGDYARLAAALGLPRCEIERVAAECRNGEAFAARIVGAPPGGMRMVGLPHAEQLLTALELASTVEAA